MPLLSLTFVIKTKPTAMFSVQNIDFTCLSLVLMFSSRLSDRIVYNVTPLIGYQTKLSSGSQPILLQQRNAFTNKTERRFRGREQVIIF